MPIASTEAQNASLDNDYGTTAGPHAASYHDLALFDASGLELESAGSPGYSRARINASDWSAADGGSKSATAVFGAPTDEWVPVTSWGLYGSDGNAWDEADFVDPLLVTGASTDGPSITITIFYNAV